MVISKGLSSYEFVPKQGLYLLWLLPFGIVLFWTCWLSDDAFVTFRTINNFLQGYGLRFNVAERVQAYTHPLWALYLVPFGMVFQDFFSAGNAAALLTSLITAYIFCRVFVTDAISAALLMALLLASDALISYSTSGLENPLSHLLVLVFFCTAFETGMVWRSVRYRLNVEPIAKLLKISVPNCYLAGNGGFLPRFTLGWI